MNTFLIPVVFFFIGAIASFINVMAGGGSVLTLGMMMLMGLDAPVANGTNRIGLLVQNISGVTAYKAEKYSNFKESLKLGSWSLPGAIIGSLFAINVSNAIFQRILAGVMLFIIITLFLPKSNRKNNNSHSGTINWLAYPSMFLVGLYGGFIQAGVGFIIMACLRQFSYLDLVKINMHKVYIILFYTIPVLFIFGFSGNIHWFYAICLASGNAVGAWLSVKLSIKKGETIVKIVLSLAMILMAVKFLLTFN